MVLFKNDIVRDGVYIDTFTKNTSFLKMALTLNKMNVRNNTFFLSLYDRDLIGRDPHNLNDDSLELRQRIAYECKINFWYFIREVVRVVSSGTDGVPYILNRANLAQAWCFLNSIAGFLTMPRQCGKTIGMVTIADWYLLLAGLKVAWGMFCNGSTLQWDNVKRFKEIRDALPKYLIHPSPADSNNKEGVTYTELGTSLQTFIAQMDKQAADRLGRGPTLAVESWDELAYFVNNDLSWSSATAAMNKAAPAARESGLPAALIITTTAGDLDDRFGKFAYNMVCNAIRFTEKFYDIENRSQLMDIIRANSKNNIVYMEYSYKQLGQTDEWFEEVTRSKDEKTVAKDYLNQWLHGSDNSIFKKEELQRISDSKKDPVETTWHGSLFIRWYQDPNRLKKDMSLRNKPYVIGSDTSDNVGRDFTTFVMMDPYNLEVVAVMRCNSTNLVFVAQCIVMILIDFPRSVFIPERNKNGAFLLDFIFLEFEKHGISPLKRIFNKYYQEYDPNANLDTLNYHSGSVRKNFGFSTTAASTSREFLFSRVLTTVIKLAADRIFDCTLVDELCGLTMKNGRIDHTDVGHDDTVISYLLAAFFILFACNHRFYGIDMDEMLCNIKNDGAECTLEEKRQIQLAKQKIDEYKSRMRHCENEIMKQAYQREIQRLESVVGERDDEVINEDNFKPLSQKASQVRRESSSRDISPSEWLSMSHL